jgi:predicted peroxiredoxin
MPHRTRQTNGDGRRPSANRGNRTHLEYHRSAERRNILRHIFQSKDDTMTPILINNSFGADNIAKATVPFIIGGAAAARGGQTAMFLTHEAIFLATKNGTSGMQAEGYKPVAELIDAFVGNGGTLWVCKACADAKGVTADDLRPGAEIAGAGHTLALLENGGQVLM